MSKEVLLATSNRGKIKEFKRLLGSKIQLHTPDKSLTVEENGTSYYENALTKAVHYFRAFQVPVLADDSGVEVDCLKGKPGVDSAILGGENLSWAERWTVLLKEIRNTGAPQPWTARFRCIS